MQDTGGSTLKRVLVVDDDPLNRRLVAACLRGDGIVIDEAADGLSALWMVFERNPDLVILDLELPQMDGVSITRTIRNSSGACCGVPIIALSATTDFDARARCADAGTNEYLAKPLADPGTLRAKVRAHLSGREIAPPSIAQPLP